MTVSDLQVELLSIAEQPAIFPIFNGPSRTWTVAVYDVAHTISAFGTDADLGAAIGKALAAFRVAVAGRNQRAVDVAMMEGAYR